MRALDDIGNAELLAAEGQRQLATALITWLASIFPALAGFAKAYITETEKRGVTALH